MVKKLMMLGMIFTLGTSHSWGQTVTCDPLIRQYEAAHGIPYKLLTAISLAESGRKVGEGVVAWPWTINANGTSYVFASKEEAIRRVRKLRLLGMRSIDVGCMQVNLKQHPKAFPTLEAAFDPATNIAYAAKFLKAKKESKGSWVDAVAHYHSSTPKHHVPYQARVLKIWQKMHPGRPSLPQFLPEISQTPIDITHAEIIARHEGEFVKNVAAPSGRRVPMIVRFTPYRGFNGGAPHMTLDKRRTEAPQMIQGRALQAGSKIIINAMGLAPSQRVFYVSGVGTSSKIIDVSAKTTQAPLIPSKARKAKTSKFRAR